jgi:hypothetical protein
MLLPVLAACSAAGGGDAVASSEDREEAQSASTTEPCEDGLSRCPFYTPEGWGSSDEAETICVDLSTHDFHCGACRNDCFSKNQICVEGACVDSPKYPEHFSWNVSTTCPSEYLAHGCGFDAGSKVGSGQTPVCVGFGDLQVGQNRPGAIDCTVTYHFEFDAGWVFDPSGWVVGYALAGPGSQGQVRIDATVNGVGVSTSRSLARQEDPEQDFAVDLDEVPGPSCGATSAEVVVRFVSTPIDEASHLVIDMADIYAKWQRCN